MKNNHSTGIMRYALDETKLKRRSWEEYKKMTKAQLLKSMMSLFGNFDTIRYKYIQNKLENNFLHRRVEILEDRLEEIRDKTGNRTFAIIDIRKRRKERRGAKK